VTFLASDNFNLFLPGHLTKVVQQQIALYCGRLFLFRLDLTSHFDILSISLFNELMLQLFFWEILDPLPT
jgi:hypothetical protein